LINHSLFTLGSFSQETLPQQQSKKVHLHIGAQNIRDTLLVTYLCQIPGIFFLKNIMKRLNAYPSALSENIFLVNYMAPKNNFFFCCVF
jgi:hypothetical protein